MFGFLKKNKARSVVLQVLPVLKDGVQALSPVDRAATYAVAHALLKVSGDTWGRAVETDPASLPDETVATVVVALADSHAKVVAEIDSMPGRGMDDVSYSQAMRQLRATECVLATVGRRWAPKGESKSVADAWRLMWNARGEADEAAAILLRFRKVAKAEGVPSFATLRGRPPGEADLVRLMTTLPAFLGKGGAKPPSTKSNHQRRGAPEAAPSKPASGSGDAKAPPSRPNGPKAPARAPGPGKVPPDAKATGRRVPARAEPSDGRAD